MSIVAKSMSATVDTLAPVQEVSDWRDFLVSVGAKLAEPFDDSRNGTLGRLSSAILRHPFLRRDNGSVALAYWLRRSNLTRLHEDAEQIHLNRSGVIARPAGLVFHIAPANVDTMFVYSWALSFLCGNANVVRVSSEQSEVMRGLLECLNDAMRDDDELLRANRFITYAHDDQVTEQISDRIALRVVWGGDETVRRIRRIPMNPHASERVFPSKYSWSIVHASSYLTAAADTRADLAKRFHGDLFPFDQMACSSPHRVIWIGDENDYRTACLRFDEALGAEIERRAEHQPEEIAVRRRNYGFSLAAEDRVSFDTHQVGFASVQVKSEIDSRPKCGGGLFAHLRLNSADELSLVAKECDQTVTHFGFSRVQLIALAKTLGNAGVDRVVPIGQALKFDRIWDGFDLVGDFLRLVAVVD